MIAKQPTSVVDPSGRFLQAVAHLGEWVKHIITIGSALMVLGAVLLKDLVKGALPPFSILIAILLVLSYTAMLVALWKCLAFFRTTASSVLTTSEVLGSGDELQELQRLLNHAQWAFLAALVLFGFLTAVSLIAWAFGYAPSARPESLQKVVAVFELSECVACHQLLVIAPFIQ